LPQPANASNTGAIKTIAADSRHSV
jgi:hypothetical protein